MLRLEPRALCALDKHSNSQTYGNNYLHILRVTIGPENSSIQVVTGVDHVRLSLRLRGFRYNLLLLE